MADATPQKRVLPARERRESAAKRRASSPIVQTAPTAKPAISQTPQTPQTPQPEPRQKRKYTKRASLAKTAEHTPDASAPGVGDEALPTRLAASKPLPVLREKQPERLSTNEYQSYADSAILAASLHRSRMQWLCEGIFKKYWVKPVKRKGVVEQPPGNPDVKTMQKLGNATITIEPHTFDVTFYTVKDPHAVQVPYQRHPNQHTTKPSHSSYPSPGVYSPSAPVTQAPPRPLSQPSALPSPAATAAGGPHAPPPGPTPSGPGSTPSTLPAKSSAAPTVPPKPTDDPVIQMLAARAATDPRLKDLMKVVAMSQATPDQLREFQAHIDEFNAVVKQRDAKKAEAEQKAQGSAAAVASPAPASAAATPLHRPGPSPGTPLHMQPPPYPVYQPPYRPEPIIKHIVVEFQSPVSSTQDATSDRWLFPEHAVLEMQPGGVEMKASFFAERRGADILNGRDDGAGPSYAADVDYYEPVTMKIRATQHRTIETIARAATTLPNVVQYMKAVMAQKTRAPREYLVYRLPRDHALPDGAPRDFVDSGVEVSEPEDDTLQDYYDV